MSGWPELVTAAIINGALLSLTLVVIMVISGAVALDMWVGDYPPDIRDKYGPMSAKARRAAALLRRGILCGRAGHPTPRSGRSAKRLRPDQDSCRR